MENLSVDVRKLCSDDFTLQPKCFANEQDGYAELFIHSMHGTIVTDGKTPVVYFRNLDDKKYRWGGFVRLGEGPLSTQTSEHHRDIAQGDTKIIGGYHKIAENPETYGFRTDNPFSEITYNENEATWKEADILDVKLEYFPHAIFVHRPLQETPIWHQDAIARGTYEGKPVEFLCGFDRNFNPQGDSRKGMAMPDYLYTTGIYCGIREDGRKESFYGIIFGKQNGEGLGIYILEGEEPVISEDLRLDADWQVLPYLPAGDQTVGYTKGVWRFGNREIHFEGKWGTKGFTEKPRLERVGQSQVLGTWYEGKTPYKHRLSHCLNESMGAYPESVKSMGLM